MVVVSVSLVLVISQCLCDSSVFCTSSSAGFCVLHSGEFNAVFFLHTSASLRFNFLFWCNSLNRKTAALCQMMSVHVSDECRQLWPLTSDLTVFQWELIELILWHVVSHHVVCVCVSNAVVLWWSEQACVSPAVAGLHWAETWGRCRREPLVDMPGGRRGPSRQQLSRCALPSLQTLVGGGLSNGAGLRCRWGASPSVSFD